MAKGNDSIGRTLFTVVILCLVCSVVVAGAAIGLKAKQEQQKLLDKQVRILEVTGLMQSGFTAEEIQTLYQERIVSRLVDLQTGQFSEQDPATFNAQSALRDPQQSRVLASSEDPAQIRRVAHLAEIFLVKDQQNQIEQLVLPVHGSGLWSMMYAFVAVDTDGNTIRGLTYYKHGETPGLGGEIANPNWLKQWRSKQLFDQHGNSAIRVVKGGANPNDPSSVDALSGATLTSNGVQNTFRFWLSDNGYGRFLRNVREGVLHHG